jgi:DNA repair protein RecO (recombination protein O)
MDIQKYHAIVLRCIPYSETSLIVNTFTREAGRVTFMAKGARRKGSTLAAVLQATHLLEIISLERDGRDLCILKEADLMDGFSGLHQDYERILTGTGICELLLRTQLERQSDTLLFDHAHHLLQLSATDCPFPGNRLYWFLLFVMSHAGFGLDLARCAGCGLDADAFASESTFGVDRASGALLCPVCASGAQIASLSPRLLRVLRFLSTCGLDEPGRREFTQETRRDLGEWLEEQAHYHLEPYRPLLALKGMV